MGEIKSALELALERTKDVKSDKTQITKQNAEEEGKKIASTFLSNIESEKVSEEKFKEILKAKNKDELKYFSKGVGNIFISYLKLPEGEIDKTMLDRIRVGFILLSGNKKEINYIFSQVEAFFAQFMQNKNDLTENLKNQFASKLQEKEAALKEQYGEDAHIKAEDDPEFKEYLHKTINSLIEQYSQAFVQVKDELLKFC
jgi:uncharacterized protein DUF6657